MAPVTEKLSRNQVIPQYEKYLSFLAAVFFVSLFLPIGYWVNYNNMAHTIIELLGISLLLFAFINVWHTYEDGSFFNNILGLALLVIAVLNLSHAANFADIIAVPDSISAPLVNILLKYGIIIAFFEVIIWFLLSFYRGKHIINKWAGLIISLFTVAVLLVSMISIARFIPLFCEYSQTNEVKMYGDTVLSAAAALIVFMYRKKIEDCNDEREAVIFRHIVLAMFAFIGSRLSFALSDTVTSRMHFLGHLMKFAYYAVIYRGIYKTTVEYPYIKVKEMKEYYEKLLYIVSEVKRTQLLENMQIQTQTILDSMENAVFIVNRDKKIVMYNKTFSDLLGIDMLDIKGMELSELSSFINVDMSRHDRINFGDGKAMNGRAYTIQTIEGRTIKLSMDCSPIYDAGNVNIGWIVVGRDITKEEREQERIIQSEKMAVIGNMAASLVHEIKNPLASIKGLCQLMSLKPNIDKITDYAAVMENAVDDISKIVSDFLQFSRPGTGAFEKGNVNELVKSLEIMISTNGYKNGITTYFNYCEIEKPVRLNKQQIKNIILSLVDNAIDAMNGAIDPKLCISTRLDETREEMQISIKDNGIGMTEEQLANVGTPFYTTKPKGTGLGISICKNIINEHGGSLKIESKFGEGSVFTISIPCEKG